MAPAVAAVGARMHTSKAPRKARLMEATGKTHRRLASRVQLTTGCAAVTDKERCCMSIDKFGDPCIAALTLAACSYARVGRARGARRVGGVRQRIL